MPSGVVQISPTWSEQIRSDHKSKRWYMRIFFGWQTWQLPTHGSYTNNTACSCPSRWNCHFLLSDLKSHKPSCSLSQQSEGQSHQSKAVTCLRSRSLVQRHRDRQWTWGIVVWSADLSTARTGANIVYLITHSSTAQNVRCTCASFPARIASGPST